MLENAKDLSDTNQDLVDQLGEAPWFQAHWADMVNTPGKRPTRAASRSADLGHPDAAGPGFAQAS